jgi:serine/threonine protein phosphatase PrpC
MRFQAQRQGDREYQEDTLWNGVIGGAQVLMVADGLGGHDAGDQASALIVESLRVCLEAEGDLELTEANAKKWFQHALVRFQEHIAQIEGAKDAHTTLACALIKGQTLLTITVGDSRVYHRSNQGLWRTKDHSVIQMLVDDGEITEAEMATHPEQGKLYRSIGPAKPAKPRVKSREYDSSDQVLVCSDGFWEAFSELDLNELLRNSTQQSLDTAADSAALKFSPKSDNISAVIAIGSNSDEESNVSDSNDNLIEPSLDISNRSRDRFLIGLSIVIAVILVALVMRFSGEDKSDESLPVGIEDPSQREACLLDGTFIAETRSSRVTFRSIETGDEFEVILPLTEGKYEVVIDDSKGDCSAELDEAEEARLKSKIGNSI